MSEFNDNMLPWLRTALDLSYRRSTLLGANISNIDTPGYTPKDVNFETYLEKELTAHEPGSSALPPTEARRNGEVGPDGNSVDLEEEMVQFTSNQLFYGLASEVLNRKLSLLRYSIDEGGR